MLNIEKKVHAFLVRHVSPGDRLIVAVSGGADSVALLHILSGLREDLGFTLSIAHLNHMARGHDSDADAEFVRGLAGKLGLDCQDGKIDVKAEAKYQKTSFQETARNLRYQFLESALKINKSTHVALGHTADDQVETFLINLLRGSGTRGLSAMPETRGPYIRPLLTCYRAEVEHYLNKKNLKFREDVSNNETYYLRNRVRKELLPFLSEYNPQIKSSLLDTVSILKDEDQYLDTIVDGLLAGFVQTVEEGAILSREFLLKQPKALQKRLVRKALQAVTGGLRRISAVNVRGIMDLMEDPKPGKEISLSRGWVVICSANRIEISKNSLHRLRILKEESVEVVPVELTIPGTTLWSKFDWIFKSQVIESGKTEISKISSQACFDYDKVGSQVFVRFFTPGDRFIPLGMSGSKKLKSFFIDEKIPREKRKTIPILTSADNDIIWIYGRRIAEPYRVTDKTVNILQIEGVSGCA